MRINWDSYVERQLQWAECLKKLLDDVDASSKPDLARYVCRAKRNARDTHLPGHHA
jgi:hypothetical protein